jgi:hypothetical protein
MLEIRDKKIVANTNEGIFYLGGFDAHYSLIQEFHNLLNTTDEDNLRENYIYARTLCENAALFYTHPDITEQVTNDSLVPLMKEIFKDKANIMLSSLILGYCIEEYWFKITKKHEIDSLRNFYFLMRDPFFTVVFKSFKYQLANYKLMVYRFLQKTHTSSSLYHVSFACDLHSNATYSEANTLIGKINEYLKNDTDKDFGIVTLETIDPYTIELIFIPYVIAKEGIKISKSVDNFPEEDIYLYNATIDIFNMLTQKRTLKEEKKSLRSGSDVYIASSLANDMEFYGAVYYIAERVHDDKSRKIIAKNLGYKHVFSYMYKAKKRAKFLFVLLAFTIAFILLRKMYIAIGGIGGVIAIAYILFLGGAAGIDDGDSKPKSNYKDEKIWSKYRVKPCDAPLNDLDIPRVGFDWNVYIKPYIWGEDE